MCIHPCVAHSVWYSYQQFVQCVITNHTLYLEILPALDYVPDFRKIRAIITVAAATSVAIAAPAAVHVLV